MPVQLFEAFCEGTEHVNFARNWSAEIASWTRGRDRGIKQDLPLSTVTSC